MSRRRGRCATATFTADQALGVRVADGFALARFPASAHLLTHFLPGNGHGGHLPGRVPALRAGAGQQRRSRR